jgi:integrase
MAKKTFVARARLVKGPRWHIDFTRINPADGSESRHRQDFDLNDIEDLRIREEVGLRLVRYIEAFAPQQMGNPVADDAGPTVKDAVALAVLVKQKLPRENSRRPYKTVASQFLKWATRLHYADMPVAKFTKKHAVAYWDVLTERPLRGRTLNNYLDRLHGLWAVLKKREIVKKNPWKGIDPVRNEEKIRRVFSAEERRIVAMHIEATDYWLFRGLLLQFFCYVRPVELTRLRFRDFDLGKGLVTVREEVHKKWRKVVKTIPKSVLHYFRDGKFEKFPANYFVFGLSGSGNKQTMAPSTTAIDDGRMYKRHTKVLALLKADGRLASDLTGLTWYSWKDTGISLHAHTTSPLATRDQAGHTSITMTEVYYHAPMVNEEYQRLENDLME